jgi:hypothetical protein
VNNKLDDCRPECAGGWTRGSSVGGARAAVECAVVLSVQIRGAAERLSATKLTSPGADDGFAVLAIGLTRRVVSSAP